MNSLLLRSLLVLCLPALTAACAPPEPVPSDAPPRSPVAMPNPFVSYDNLETARAAFGAPFAVPSTPKGYRLTRIAVTRTGNAALAQLLYEQGVRQVLYRVTPTPDDGDQDARMTRISGDYNRYAEHGTLNAGPNAVATRGRDGAIFAAYWERGGFSHSLTARYGLPPAQVRAIVESVTD